jgi:hypothetical protein
MYLTIFEDGTIRQSLVLADEDFESVEDGIIDILRVNDSGFFEQYYNSEWNEVEEL